MRNETGLLKRKKKNYYFVGDAYKQSLNCKDNHLIFGFTYPILFTPSPEQHDTLQVHAYVFWSGLVTEDKPRSGKNKKCNRMRGVHAQSTWWVGRPNIKADFQSLGKGFQASSTPPPPTPAIFITLKNKHDKFCCFCCGVGKIME